MRRSARPSAIRRGQRQPALPSRPGRLLLAMCLSGTSECWWVPRAGRRAAIYIFRHRRRWRCPRRWRSVKGRLRRRGRCLILQAPRFQWNAVTGVAGLTGYQINLYDKTMAKSYSYSVGVSVTSFSPPATVLVGGDQFVWNVRILVGTQSGPPERVPEFPDDGSRFIACTTIDDDKPAGADRRGFAEADALGGRTTRDESPS